MFERMIESTKSFIKKMVGKNVLRTLITEVKSIVNDRPISYATTADINDLSPLLLLLDDN